MLSSIFSSLTGTVSFLLTFVYFILLYGCADDKLINSTCYLSWHTEVSELFETNMHCKEYQIGFETIQTTWTSYRGGQIPEIPTIDKPYQIVISSLEPIIINDKTYHGATYCKEDRSILQFYDDYEIFKGLYSHEIFHYLHYKAGGDADPAHLESDLWINAVNEVVENWTKLQEVRGITHVPRIPN